MSGYAFLIVALSVLYVATFVPACSAARRGNAAGRYAGLGVGAAGVILLALLSLFALFVFGLRCDESCNENLVPSARTPGWQNTIHAWQWDAELAIALIALALALLATLLLGVRREALAAAAGVLAATLVVIWAVFLFAT